MNKLLIQYKNNKFVNNIQLSSIDFCGVFIGNTQSQLYKLFYENQFTHIIFIASLLGNEELSFIEEFGKNVHIYIYEDKPVVLPKNLNISAVLAPSPNKTKESTYKIINMPKLVNNEVFNKLDNVEKLDKIICFIDHIDSIPDNLNQLLYPNPTSLPILLFNNSAIIHPQNLGTLNEKDKAELLKTHKYYLALDDNDEYVPEAWACDTIVLTTEDVSSLKPTKFKTSKYFQSYCNFLRMLLSGKK